MEKNTDPFKLWNTGDQEWQRNRRQYLDSIKPPPPPKQESSAPPMTFPGSSPVSGPFSYPSGGGSSGSSGGGLFSSIGDGMGSLSVWMIEHIWPLSALQKLAERVTAIGWRLRLPSAIVGALIFAGLVTSTAGQPAAWPWAQSLLTSMAGDSTVVVALALGAIIGWILPSVLGATIMISVFLVGLALALAVIALACGLVYAVVSFVIHQTRGAG